MPEQFNEGGLGSKRELPKPLTFEALLAARQHKASSGLPDVKPQDQALYTNFMIGGNQVPDTGYEFVNAAQEYAKEHPDLTKFDFGKQGRVDLGWKGHLNLAPENSEEVSTYLRAHGYRHKFLAGGEPEDGKVFTIYFGARSVVNQWAPRISKDLDHVLAKPTDTEEVEFARGLVGRFAVRSGEGIHKYTPYGTCGLPLLKAGFRDRSRGTSYQEYVAGLSDGEIAKIYRELEEDFGSYFTG